MTHRSFLLRQELADNVRPGYAPPDEVPGDLPVETPHPEKRTVGLPGLHG
jgi:hypothetical protein